MSETWAQLGVTAAVVLPVAAIPLTVMVRRGALQPNALRDVPTRHIGLEPLDLALALLLPLLALVNAVMLWRAGPSPAPAPATVPLDANVALRHALMGQAFNQLPFAAWFVIRAAMRGQWRRSGLLPTRPGRDVSAAVLTLLAALPWVMGVHVLTSAVGLLAGQEPPVIGHDLLRIMRDEGWTLVMLGLLASAVLIAPLLEELIFRGLLQTAMLETFGWERRWPVILAAAAAFAGVHVGAAAWQAMPGLFVLGVILGWLYERTGSLWPSILLHMMFNAVNSAIVLSGLVGTEAA